MRPRYAFGLASYGIWSRLTTCKKRVYVYYKYFSWPGQFSQVSRESLTAHKKSEWNGKQNNDWDLVMSNWGCEPMHAITVPYRWLIFWHWQNSEAVINPGQCKYTPRLATKTYFSFRLMTRVFGRGLRVYANTLPLQSTLQLIRCSIQLSELGAISNNSNI